MSEQPRKPPALAAAILNFFSHQPDFPSLAGDFLEEFQQRADTDGAEGARRWFWREALRNAWALTVREVGRSPWRTMFTALGCLLALNFATDLLLFGWLRGSDLYRALLFDTLLRWLLLAVQVVAPFAIGWAGGKLLEGREWALVLVFMGVYMVLGTGGAAYWILHHVSIATTVLELAIWANTLRAVFFSLGCLWARRTRLKAA